MPNFEDNLNDPQQHHLDNEDEDDYANDLIYQENHCYTIQKTNAAKNNQPQSIFMNKIK